MDAQVVVDCLGNMEDLQVVIGSGGEFLNDARRVGRVVAADVEKVTDVVLFKLAKDFFAVGAIRLIARRTERRLHLRRHLPADRSHWARASGAGRHAHSSLP